jgi:hypothetical protein
MARLRGRRDARLETAVIPVYAKLAVATALLLAPGWLVARTLGVRSLSAAVAWSLVVLFGALALVFALGSTLWLAIAVLGIVAAVAAGARLRRPWPAAASVPGRWWAFAAGAVLGLALWPAAREVDGDGLFHLARARKLLELDALSLERVSEFVDGSLHPGYAFPLWHGFLAIVAQLSGEDPEVVVRYLPTVLTPLAVVVAYEVGWALFRRVWAAGAASAAQVALTCLAPGFGGAYPILSLPASSSRHLLVPAALGLALETLRRPSWSLGASTAAAGLALAVVHPTYAIFLWIPLAGFLGVRALWARSDLRAGAAALAALVVPSALFMLWLVPVVTATRSVSPDAEEVQRAFDKYAGQLDIRSDTLYSLAAEVFTRRGAIAIASLLLIVLAGFAARRRWAAFVVGGSLAVFAVMLVPFLFAPLADLVSISQARRASSFLPYAFAFAGGIGVLARLVGPLTPLLALGAGVLLQVLYPGDTGYRIGDTAPALVTWLAVGGTVAALVVGLRWRLRTPLEAAAPLAVALFLAPVAISGVSDWRPDPPRALASLSDGLVEALRRDVPAGAIVYSDEDTSYRLAGFAPVYIAVAPPAHVADTEENRPYERARDARRFVRTGDLSIPESYGAEYLVSDRLRRGRDFELPIVYEDGRFTLYRLPRSA